MAAAAARRLEHPAIGPGADRFRRPVATPGAPLRALRYPRRMRAAIAAAVFLGIVATSGDFVWEHWNIRHTMLYGVIHGAVFCLAIGAAIGLRAGRVAPAIVAGPLVGVLAAGVFYLLAPMMRMRAMFPAWMLFWVCFALLQRQLRREPAGHAIARGLAAAVLSGIAFYLVSGIWTDRAPGGPNYLRNLLSWTFAFLPGFAALFWPIALSPSSADRRAGSPT